MKNQKIKKNEKSLIEPIRKDKIKKKQGISRFLINTIKKYQFDIVGWTEFCVDNKNLKQKALPKYRENPLEDLRLKERNLSSAITPSLKKVFKSKETLIDHLENEYSKDQAFYEAILNNPGKYRKDIDDKKLNEEIDRSAKKYLKNIKKRKNDEEKIINTIKPEDWIEISKSKYPKVKLGLLLGLSSEAIINNFGLYFINQLKAEFMGSRTAYLTSSGPSSWHEIERIEKELAYFKKEVVIPMIKKEKKDA